MIRSPEKFRAKQDIDVRTGHEVLEIDGKGRRVRVRRLDGNDEWWESYDQLLIATGALPFRPELPGAEALGIYGVHSLQSGALVRQAIDEGKPKRGVIVGGGYIGLEMAESLCRRGIEVSLVDRNPQVMGTLDPDMGSFIGVALGETGVALHLDEALLGFEVADGAVCGVVTDRRTLPADIVILGMGVRPNSGLAQLAGIPLGEKGSIRVDNRLRTGIDGIWAAGDCAENFHLVSRRPFYVALGTVANKQGRVAGINLGGGDTTFPGVVGTAVTKVCELEVARTGLQEKELKRLGLRYQTATIKSQTRAGYYPGVGPITVKLLAEQGSGRLLGGQIIGTEGSAKRIDIVAVALHAGFNVAQLIDLDLGYAPPFSPVWDPVHIAARELAKLV